MGPRPQELQGFLVAAVDYVQKSVDPKEFVQYVNGILQSMLSAHDADPQAEFSIGRELIQGVMENAGLRGASLTNNPTARPTASPTTASTVFPPWPQPTPSPVSQSNSSLSPAQIAMWVGIVMAIIVSCMLCSCLQRYCKNKGESCADWLSGKETNKAATQRVAAEGTSSSTQNPLLSAQEREVLEANVREAKAKAALAEAMLQQFQSQQNGYQSPQPVLTGNNRSALLTTTLPQKEQHADGEEKTGDRVLTNPVASLGGNGEEAKV